MVRQSEAKVIDNGMFSLRHLPLALVFLALTVPAEAGEPSDPRSSLGSSGHYLSQFMPEVFLANPEGRSFTITVHRYIWPVPNFNGGFSFSVLSPDGTEVASGSLPKDESSVTLKIAAGEPGTYQLSGRVGGYALFWITSDLEEMVAWAGDIGTISEGKPGYKVLMLHPIAPERWYFYVPEGTKSFTIGTAIGTWQTHREDYGMVVMNPRGQRVAALYGGLSPSEPRLKESRPILVDLEPDEGTTGRFWSVWVTGGDSHSYSDSRIILDQVPPYVSTSPEAWFDPTTGTKPEQPIYDESAIRELPAEPEMHPVTGEPLTTDHYKLAPAPFLGDEDYNGVQGAASVYLFNPENRALDFGAGSYLPPGGEHPLQYRAFGPNGKLIEEKKTVFRHNSDYRIHLPSSGPGIYRIEVDAPSWYAWSEPAVPMVLAGHEEANGSRFHLETSIARHWFFQVPKGTKEFQLEVSVPETGPVLNLEIHSPSRLVEPVHVRGNQPAKKFTIPVPPGDDGKIWFFRASVGSATEFPLLPTEQAKNARVPFSILFQNIPGYLAPTWEQWFDPRK